MTLTTCPACGGTYAATASDGVPYFHACPPLGPAELAAAGRVNVDELGGETLRPGHRDENVEARRGLDAQGNRRVLPAGRRATDGTR